MLLANWATVAVSLFNTILLLWLGLTVLLNAERRTAGVWLVGAGLLMGGLFFVSHTAILGHNLDLASQGVNFWWQVGWVPVVALPLAWYGAMLWYAGFWDARESPLRRRQRAWLILALVLGIAIMGLLLFTNALPSYWQVIQLDLGATPSVAGVPLLIAGYPLYVVLCIGLSLDALRRPGPSSRAMGDVARRRARPWLMAASLALLLASLLVTIVLLWVALNALRDLSYRTYAEVSSSVAWFDLLIAALIGAAIVLLGQAVVTYEIFTGKTLPRRGLLRHWHRAIVLAAGYGSLIGLTLTLRLRAIYGLLLTTALMVAFYALLAWRSYAERERYIGQLRPFVASQHLYEHLLTPTTPPELDALPLFGALCQNVLDASAASLIAVGPLAPLVGSPLVYPDRKSLMSPALAEITPRFETPQVMCVPLDPARHDGAVWAVPLYGTRGLAGVLLLAEKRDGGLYTQEEIEIARASGERLIDTQASAEMARRLMALQRQRLAQSQILDQSTRRVLHDDVLPRLHAAMLTLGDADASTDVMSLLARTHRQIANLLHEMPAAAAPQVSRLGLIDALRQAVDGQLGGAFDGVTWEIEPQARRETRIIPPLTAEVIYFAAREAVRNAARHGRGPGGERPLTLHIAARWCAGLELTIEDTGVGLEATGRPESHGQGLALHSTMMAVVGGTLAIESVPGACTRVTLKLPQPV